MKHTPFQEIVLRINKSLPQKDNEIADLAMNRTRPLLAVRQRNGITVCLFCGNTMVYREKNRYAKCHECEKNVEIIEEDDWLAYKRCVPLYFASLEVIDNIQLMRTYETIFRYSAINQLNDVSVHELCRHWMTSEGYCEVTSLRRFCGAYLTPFRSMVLRNSSTDNEDYIANHAIVLPDMTLLSELDGKLGMYEKLIQGNILATIKNILKPNNSHI